MSGGSARTIRRHCLELWPGLVLQAMGEVEFHVFWKYWKLTSSPNTSKCVLGPPDWSSDFFKARVPSQELSNKLICQQMTPEKKRKLDNLPKSSCFDKMASFFMPFFEGTPSGAKVPKNN